MAEHTSPLNKSQAPISPSELFFASPISCSDGMTEQEWAAECDRMFAHSRLTQRFVSGLLCPDDYMDGLADLGEEPYLLDDLWSEGGSLLLPG